MSELTPEEFEFIRTYFGDRRFDEPQHIIEIEVHMSHFYNQFHCRPIVESLVLKNVFSRSPDQQQVKFTDYGIELVKSMSHAQADWESKPIARVQTTTKDQIVIRAGETFKADRVLREIFAQATSALYIIDPYIGPRIFDLLEDSGTRVLTKIITSNKTNKLIVSVARAFVTQYPHVEMRILSGDIHDRFVLWDGKTGFHIGHSLKDLGTKDTQLSRIRDATEQLRLFEDRWAKAQPLGQELIRPVD